jgi:thioredoxin
MDVTTATFQRDVIERSHELPVVVDFWAAWCGPCRMLGPAIEAEVAKREDKLELAKIDVDAEQALAAQYGIQSIPTVAVFRDGNPVTASSAPTPPPRSAASSTRRSIRTGTRCRPLQPDRDLDETHRKPLAARAPAQRDRPHRPLLRSSAARGDARPSATAGIRTSGCA